jgi:hypothetical protein
MDTETETLIAVLHDRMEKMTEQERIDLLRSIAGDYCPKCGYDNGGRYCPCDNDE